MPRAPFLICAEMNEPMRIVEVISRSDLNRFITFPDELYRECPQYVPALHSDQRHSLMKSASLKYCRRRMWLAIDGSGKVCGRICAMVNPHYNELYGKRYARFGWFDTVNDDNVAGALLDTACGWARAQGMTHIHGPLYYNTLGKQGMLVEGFQNIPQFNTLYNYPYYVDIVQKYGFVKECDWVQYKMSDFHTTERIAAISARVQERCGLHYGNIDGIKKDKDKVRAFLQMYSDIFARSVYNFIPFTQEEMDEEAKLSIPMLDRRHCCVVLDEDDEIAAFGISFPSISNALRKARGTLFPFGWFHLLKALKFSNDTVDLMLIGASQKWAGKGVSSMLHTYLSEQFGKMGAHYFITNPQIETNSAAFVWGTYENEPYMRRRCFIKEL